MPAELVARESLGVCRECPGSARRRDAPSWTWVAGTVWPTGAAVRVRLRAVGDSMWEGATAELMEEAGDVRQRAVIRGIKEEATV